MQITLKQYEHIQNYLDGLMTPQEEKDFLIELDKNISLKEGFDFERDLRDNLYHMEEKKEFFEKPEDYYEVDKNADDYNSIKSLIEAAGEEWEQENKGSQGVNAHVVDNKSQPHKAIIFNMKSWVAIAAAACVVLAIVSLILFWPKSHTPPVEAKTIDTSSAKKNTNTGIVKISPGDSAKKVNPEIKKVDGITLFKKYYAKDKSNPPMPELLVMVPKDYQKGDYAYDEKIDLERLPNTRGSSNDINSKQNILQFGHYYKGLSYIEKKDNKEAIENLQWVIDSSQNQQLKIKAKWYLTLVYLKENNLKKALPLLSSLSENTNELQYHKQATEILETLRGKEEK
jgi:tetratricopeptide (TPR) repeat protein